eukprot:837068-Rhodomonas_salina.3
MGVGNMTLEHVVPKSVLLRAKPWPRLAATRDMHNLFCTTPRMNSIRSNMLLGDATDLMGWTEMGATEGTRTLHKSQLTRSTYDPDGGCELVYAGEGNFVNQED